MTDPPSIPPTPLGRQAAHRRNAACSHGEVRRISNGRTSGANRSRLLGMHDGNRGGVRYYRAF